MSIISNKKIENKNKRLSRENERLSKEISKLRHQLEVTSAENLSMNERFNEQMEECMKLKITYEDLIHQCKEAIKEYETIISGVRELY